MVNIGAVLLAEDDEHIRLIMRICLTKLTNWRILEARNGLEALELAAKDKPDLFLLDIMMPGMDGITLFRELQKNDDFKAIPVIFMTAKVQKEEVEAYTELGAKGVITKPVDPLLLPDQIMDILNK